MTTVAVLERDTPAALTTEVVTEYGAFVGLESEWNDAVRRAGTTHPFLLHEWLRTWWDCFAAGRALRIVIVRRGGQIVAIAPLMLEHTQMYGLSIRKLDLLHNDHTPRAEFIVADGANDAFEAIWQELRRADDDWDLLQLSRLPSGSATLERLRTLADRDACATGTWRGDVSPYLALCSNWDAYYGSLPAKFRSNLRNRLTRLTKLGEPRLEILDHPRDVAAARDDALRLEASGWKRDSGTSICSDQTVQRFYTLLAERAAERGWLRLLFLTVAGRRIATSYGSCFDRRMFLFKTGYDPEYAPCAPFKLLTYFAIQAACTEGLREVDFLGDAEPWKLEWTDAARAHDWLFVFSGGIRARLLHSLKFQMVPGLKRWRA